MSRQNILIGAKASCLQMFEQLVSALPRRSADNLFAMAYKTTNFTEHRIFLDAYKALSSRDSVIEKQLKQNLTLLLTRGIETAYNHTRLSLAEIAPSDDWSLVEGDAIDKEIRLHKVTNLFHIRSGEDIRTLNLRIAAIFDQDIVKERENPFRPYLFSRCILETITQLRLPPDVTEAVIEQLASELVDGAAAIYQALNAFFEKNGVPARLAVRPPSAQPIKSEISEQAAGTSRTVTPVDDDADAFAGTHDKSAISAGQGAPPSGRNNYSGPRTRNVMPDGANSKPASKVDQLFRMVRRKNHAPPLYSGSTNSNLEREPSPAHLLSAEDAGSRMAVETDALPPPHAAENFPMSWAASGQVVRDTLQSIFAMNEHQAGTSHDAAASVMQGALFTPNLGAIYHHLQAIAAPNSQDMLGVNGDIRNLIFESRSNLLSKASGANEMMTIDVVGMIFEFILCDTQVPAEVRAQLGRLQFHLLKIALSDPQLLAQKNHPARRLINRIGTVSIGSRPNDPLGPQFMAEIQRIVEAMLTDESGSIAVISRLFDEFEAFVAKHLRSVNAGVENVVEAIEVAEKRSVYYARLWSALKKIFSTVKTDPYLQDFIENTWLHAIEKAEHGDAQLARRYRALAPELVWSILAKGNERERSRLLAHLPQMLYDLKAGLAAIKYQERQTFLSWLIENHTSAIKGLGFSPDQTTLSTLRKQFEDFIDDRIAVDVIPAGSASLDRRFIREAAAEMEVRLDEIETILEFGSNSDGADLNQIAGGPPAESAETQEILGQLRVGVPVEINVDGAPQKAILNWLNANATNMVLSFEGKTAPTTISVVLFRRLLANDRARFIEAAPLFERAVTSLLETANKVDQIFE